MTHEISLVKPLGKLSLTLLAASHQTLSLPVYEHGAHHQLETTTEGTITMLILWDRLSEKEFLWLLQT
jgi:hypothetical protein